MGKQRKKKLKKYGDQLSLQLMEHKEELQEVVCQEWEECLVVECLEEVCLEWEAWEECQIWVTLVEDHHHHLEVIHLDLKLMKLIKSIIIDIYIYNENNRRHSVINYIYNILQ